jgi:hypothetical protein
MRRFMLSLLGTTVAVSLVSSPDPLAQRGGGAGGAAPAAEQGQGGRGGAQAGRGGAPVAAPRPGTGGAALTVGPYDAVSDWPIHDWAKPGYIWGSQAGIFPESEDRVFLASRGELKVPGTPPANFNGVWAALGLGGATTPLPEMRNVIVVVNKEGKLIEAWNQWDHLFEGGRGPHQIYISPYDPERKVWVVDDMRHVIFIFSNDGKRLLKTMGELDEFGDNDDEKRFRRPTQIAWAQDGSFFVADGYGNTRIVKFDKNGNFLKRALSGAPTPMRTVHGVAVAGSPERVFVSDRSNARIQVFDTDLNFIEYWPNIAPHTIVASADGHIWAYDQTSEKLAKFDLSGRLEYSFGTSGVNGNGRDQRKFWGVHQIAADSKGNLYVAEVFNGRADKFVPRPGADPSQIVWGQELMPKPAAAGTQ